MLGFSPKSKGIYCLNCFMDNIWMVTRFMDRSTWNKFWQRETWRIKKKTPIFFLKNRNYFLEVLFREFRFWSFRKAKSKKSLKFNQEVPEKIYGLFLFRKSLKSPRFLLKNFWFFFWWSFFANFDFEVLSKFCKNLWYVIRTSL